MHHGNGCSALIMGWVCGGFDMCARTWARASANVERCRAGDLSDRLDVPSVAFRASYKWVCFCSHSLGRIILSFTLFTYLSDDIFDLCDINKTRREKLRSIHMYEMRHEMSRAKSPTAFVETLIRWLFIYRKKEEIVDQFRFSDLDRGRSDRPLIAQESDSIGLADRSFRVRCRETGLQLTDLDGQCCHGSVWGWKWSFQSRFTRLPKFGMKYAVNFARCSNERCLKRADLILTPSL
jgi:hypothetical protein